MGQIFKHQVAIDGKATDYVCENHACRMPTTEMDEMLSLIEASD